MSAEFRDLGFSKGSAKAFIAGVQAACLDDANVTDCNNVNRHPRVTGRLKWQ